MDKLFLSVLNMSLTGAFVIAAIVLARIALKNAPKSISYFLWAVVAFNLVCPFKIQSPFSLNPFGANTISESILVPGQQLSFGESALGLLNTLDGGETYIPIDQNAVDINSAPYNGIPYSYVFSNEMWLIFGAYIWLVGFAAMFVYCIASIVRIKHMLRNATHIRDNIYECQNIKTPFAIGFYYPKIYIPDVLTADERRYIVLHEQTHIKRGDHIIKMLAYIILCIHWFNPLVWIAFLLMSEDMEMSCDEKVMNELGSDIRYEYSLSLVRAATNSKITALNYFGEGRIKERVKRMLNFKKPTKATIIVSVTLAAVLTVGFAVNKAQSSANQNESNIITSTTIGDYSIDSSENITEAVVTTELTDNISSTDAELMDVTQAEKDSFDIQSNDEEVKSIEIDCSDALIDFVEAFGLQLQKVSLLASAEEVSNSMQMNYSDFIAPELLSKWIAEPQNAFGRAASSPWPDRIEITDCYEVASNIWTVNGNIIWITSVELINGGASEVQPIQMTVVKDNDKFIIVDMTTVTEQL